MAWSSEERENIVQALEAILKRLESIERLLRDSLERGDEFENKRRRSLAALSAIAGNDLLGDE